MNGAATTGDNNIAIGVSAGDALTSSPDNIFIGHNAGGSLTTAGTSIAIGKDALSSYTTGNGTNVAIGYEALKDLVTANSNTAIGYQAMKSANHGDADQNTVIGYQAGNAITSGQKNTIIGNEAGVSRLTTGDKNTAVGAETLGKGADAALTGDANTAMGFQALLVIKAGGESNTAIGYQAQDSLTTGAQNTSLGAYAGDSISTGTNNTIVGYNANTSAAGGTNQIMIGHSATGQGDNTATIGDDNITDVYMAEDGFAKVHAGAMHISSSTANYSSTSASLHIEGSGSSVVAVDGTNGRLFSVTDEMSGSIFSANTIAGIPVIEATSAYEVKLDPYNNGSVYVGSYITAPNQPAFSVPATAVSNFAADSVVTVAM